MDGESETANHSVKSHSLWSESSAGGASSAEAGPGHANNHVLGDDLSFPDILDI